MQLLRYFFSTVSLACLACSSMVSQAWNYFGEGSEGTYHLVDATTYLYVDVFGDILWRRHNGISSKVYTAGNVNRVEDITSTPNGHLIAVVSLFQTNAGRVIKSTNKGASWQEVLVSGMEDPHNIYFFNDTLGFIMGADQQIWRTADAGSSWKRVHGGSNVSYRSMHFINHLEGYVTGGGFHLSSSKRTIDGGKTWVNWDGCRGQSCNSISFGSLCTSYSASNTAVSKWDRRTGINIELVAPEGSGFSTVYFINDLVGILAVDTNMVGLPYYHDESLLYITYDGGESWTLQVAPYPIARPTEIQLFGNKLYMNCGSIEHNPVVLVMELPDITPFTVTGNVLDPVCNQWPNGEIQLSMQGGTPPYNIFWLDSIFTTNPLTELSSGQYNLFVTDNYGLCTNENFTLSASSTLDASLRVRNETYFNANGSISVTPEGGMEPYEYLWSHDHTLNDPFAENLSAGRYIVTVTDAYGCETTHTGEVKRVSVIAGSPVLTVAINPFGGNIIVTRGDTEISGEINFRLVSIRGEIVYSGKFDNMDEMIINAENLAPGIYFLQLATAKSVQEVIPVIWTE